MPRRKVLHIIDSLGPGGAQVVIENLVRFSDKQHYEHRVATLHGRGIYQERLEAHGIQVISLARSRKDPRLVWRLLRCVRRWRPDVVHTHLAVSGFLADMLRPFFPSGTSLVASLQNMYGDNRDFPYQDTLEYLAYRRADALAACSQAVANSLHEARRRHAPLGIIHNGVADELLSAGDASARQRVRSELRTAAYAPVILSASRLATQKNLDYALDVVGELQRLEPRLEYWIAGTGPEEEALRGKVARLSLEKTVRFLGYRDDVGKLMRAADIFFLPSHYEGLPLVLAEAMGSGTVCAVTPFEAAGEMIRDQENGIVVPFDDPKASARKLHKAIEHPEQGNKMADAALVDSREKFAASVMTRHYEELYEKVLKKQNNLQSKRKRP